jgi:putative acetyltransferase
MLALREEEPGDRAGVRLVNERAFGRAVEAALVDALRDAAGPRISLVAVDEGRVVGHIVFIPVSIVSEGGDSPALALGVLSVLPERQRQGIGSQLVRRGLEECKQLGHDVVVVVGHPDFYPRFGFLPAGAKGLRCQYEVPDEAFMVAELTPGALAGRRGTIKYPPEFNTA